MASYNQPAGNDPNGHLNAMLARLQAGGRNPSSGGEDTSSRDLLSRFAALNQANQSHNSFYGGHQSEDQGSPLMTASDVFPPPAPTPPMSHFSHSHGPPGMVGMNLGPIGSMPPIGANKPDQSASLLSLLKYSSGSGNHSASQSHSNSQASPTGLPQSGSMDGSISLSHSSIPPTLHAPVPMSADPQGILASLMKGDSHHEPSRTEMQPLPAPANKWNTAPPDDTQAYLLNLLQRKKPSQTDQPSTNDSSQPTTLTPPSATHDSTTDQTRDFLSNPESNENVSQGTTPLPFPFLSQQQHQQPQHHAVSPPASFENGSPSSQNGLGRKSNTFDYNNLFEDLGSSPHNRTPKSATSGIPGQGVTAPGIQILKKAPSAASSPGASEYKRTSSYQSPAMSPEHVRHKIESPAAFDADRSQNGNFAEEGKETVSDAISNLAENADRQAQEALARAEDEETQGRIARELEDMMSAKTEAEFDERSEIAARDIKNELDKQANAGVLEESFSPEVAQVVRDIVDEAASGHTLVADSWESAEADEIIVIEETSSPQKVYNFPMKPWISITLQDNEEIRPQFRGEVILDIARVKKEFDQIDRNLVCATETYIIYGMSKAGGLRVIRQEDGSDAKLFTDTKDRIFNIAVSSTPADINAAHKESIIGTGVSGTVYYVLIKNGDKDYSNDAHPEQYGFALPPISTQEGDAPGGVLKTRARTSSNHPEYFAVGRGKTISIIWPSYIMQNNLFKPGHDRVVDTERLSRQCSLRINTGKAGKDFTFSQDDTTIVSLDKSGRVKFWDVRDLTAADDGSDSRFPMPAQTSLEVKEPLMTLTTTPEGEKAWPTSVLLLDKQRPYQKRCALRYMIVGMKQNHTLQLWDLALGKPVQEFNLPHSKESDAVCSVMYHPPTGMIVVGHPTRNSIYFLHLSAPKYTIKGLSQVDYIQRLVAKDSSIPEPDSTAVISGVREYSFSNKGTIRSLDMLVSPAASSEDDEQTLFELYAMHSKGVAGICVKQHELGWTKDNKVVEPVDAVDAGIVKITKLKELPSSQPAEPQVLEDAVSLPVRTTARSNGKGSVSPLAQPASSEDQTQKAPDELTHSTTQPDRKVVDAPVTPNNQADKSEKKSRKKRDKTFSSTAAAEKSVPPAEQTTQSNGNAHAANVGHASVKHTEPKSSSDPSQAAMSSDSLQAAVKQVESTVSNAVEVALRENRQKMDGELRSRDAAFNKSQQKLLDLVSSTLDDNVQKVLTRTISDKVEDNVVPALEQVIRQTVSDQLSRIVSEQLDAKISGKISHAIQNQMQKLLPMAVSQALQKPDLGKAVTDKIAKSLAMNIEKTFHDTLHETITPNFTRMAITAATSIGQDIQRQAAGQIEELEQKLRADSNKIDKLQALVNQLSETVSAMASSQSQFQDGFLKSQKQASRDHQSQSANQSQYSQTPQTSHMSNQSFANQIPQQNQSYASPSAHSGNQLMPYASSGSGRTRDHDLERKIGEVSAQIDRGETEAALVRWLQSDRKEEIFDEYLVKLDTRRHLNGLSPLVSLAAIAEIARDLQSDKLREKIDWLAVIIYNMHNSLPHIDNQVREVIPNILGGTISQMESLIMSISINTPHNMYLQRLTQMIVWAKQIVDAASNPSLASY